MGSIRAYGVVFRWTDVLVLVALGSGVVLLYQHLLLPQHRKAIAVGALLFATDSIQALGAVLRMIGVINAVELGAVHLHRNL